MSDFRQTSEYQEIYNRIDKAVRQLPARLAVVAVNFSKERFVQKNWIDRSTTPWKKTKKRKGSTLVASGRLKRSIRRLRISPSQIVIGTDTPYARAHNDGLEIKGTEMVRSHRRKPHKRRTHVRKGKYIKEQQVKGYTVKKHSRKYRRKFEKRQFIGKSRELQNRLQCTIERELSKAISSNKPS